MAFISNLMESGADFVAEHGQLRAMIADYYGGDINDAREALEDRYCGEWRNVTEYAEHLTEETGGLEGIPDNIAPYIDYEAMGRDMEAGVATLSPLKQG
ncbi:MULTISPECIES: antirestriction protein ArdA [Enterovibrio]|nr:MULTISPECIES: antirestriction protein ArdA [Enterovibrio]